MRVTPKTSEEIAAEDAKFAAWPRGNYDFEVISASDKISSKGNEMIELEIMVFDRHGNKRKLKDWLLDAMPKKMKHACEAVGLHEQYEAGNVEPMDFEGRSGRVTLNIEKSEQFGDRNRVDDYVPGARPVSPTVCNTNSKQKGGGKVDIDDEIPFAACWQ